MYMKKVLLFCILGISSTTAFSQEVSKARQATVTQQSGTHTQEEKNTNTTPVLNSTSKTGQSVQVKQPESTENVEHSGEKKPVAISTKRQQD